MTFVKIKAVIGPPDKKELKEVEFLADSGSWYMVLTPSLARDLGLTQVGSKKLTLADGRAIEAPLTIVYLRAFGEESMAFADIADTPLSLFGISTMEDLGVEIDPTSGEAKKVRPSGLLL